MVLWSCGSVWVLSMIAVRLNVDQRRRCASLRRTREVEHEAPP
jgi:hypothetical protein